ncbi:MAG: GNAT family N-acetyltransferase [Pseudonocardiales bacterium]|nr:MAG: GNAT family N-acetyltransferase [Pseudonocardiales bacterium]
MAQDVRLLAAEDRLAAWELSRLAFGGSRQSPPQLLELAPGRYDWGAFDDAGRLVARAVDREQCHWFGGRLVPASGVASVAVAPEIRGTGLARRILTALLAAARDRGAVISTLFPTTQAPYRRVGYEAAGALAWTVLPTSALAAIRQPSDVVLRPAEPADVPAVPGPAAACWSGRSRRSTRPRKPYWPATTGSPWPWGGGGAIEGYASWDRGPGYDASGRLSVFDLMGLTGPATTALLAMLGTWTSVAPALELRLPEPDPAILLAPFVGATVQSSQPWMLWPEHVAGSVDLLLTDDMCPWNAGPHRLVLDGGYGRLEVGGGGDVRPALLDHF